VTQKVRGPYTQQTDAMSQASNDTEVIATVGGRGFDTVSISTSGEDPMDTSGDDKKKVTVGQTQVESDEKTNEWGRFSNEHFAGTTKVESSCLVVSCFFNVLFLGDMMCSQSSLLVKKVNHRCVLSPRLSLNTFTKTGKKQLDESGPVEGFMSCGMKTQTINIPEVPVTTQLHRIKQVNFPNDPCFHNKTFWVVVKGKLRNPWLHPLFEGRERV